MFLFNSTDKKKKLPKKIAIITDDDRFPQSKEKEYSIDNLVADSYKNHIALHTSLIAPNTRNRIKNLESVANKQTSISVNTAFQTLEYDLCYSNLPDNLAALQNNFLYKYLKANCPDPVVHMDTYLSSLKSNFSKQEQEKLAILMWKCMPSKAVFAQDFALHIIENIAEAKTSFVVPPYIVKAFNHLKN
jgi:putative ATP-dependent endonuclease of OLD family